MSVIENEGLRDSSKFEKGLKRILFRSFQEELKRHPENVYTHLYLGDVYMEKRECSNALTHFQKALEYPNLSDAERVRKLISSMQMPHKNH